MSGEDWIIAAVIGLWTVTWLWGWDRATHAYDLVLHLADLFERYERTVNDAIAMRAALTALYRIFPPDCPQADQAGAIIQAEIDRFWQAHPKGAGK